MNVPRPPRAVAALASFVRTRLTDVSDTIAPLLRTRSDGVQIVTTTGETSMTTAARQLATVIVAATAPFASTSYARTRLIRQLHAGGLLTADEVRQVGAVLDLDAVENPGGPEPD